MEEVMPGYGARNYVCRKAHHIYNALHACMTRFMSACDRSLDCLGQVTVQHDSHVFNLNQVSRCLLFGFTYAHGTSLIVRSL